MNNNQKLYLIEKKTSVMFLSSKEKRNEVEKEGLSFMKEEIEFNGLKCGEPITLSQVNSETEIPDLWKGALLWGSDDEITATEFLTRTHDPEYNLYCLLKNKYENK